jgi:DNA-binding CsgD family transcriptional regulator
MPRTPSSAVNASTATAVLSALRLSAEHGGAGAALHATGIELPQSERFAGMTDELGAVVGRSPSDESVGKALSVGYLAGQLAVRPRAKRTADPTSFVMDRNLVVQSAEGESVMRLPWFDDGLFVGRQLPDISEMPTPIRTSCVKHYTAALAGERSRFSFISYGHAYWVDAVPVYGDGGRVDVVLAVAIPAPSHTAAATAYEETAARLEGFADAAEQRAETYRHAGRDDKESAERQAAARARTAARRAAAHALRLHSRGSPGAAEPRRLTPRETEVLQLTTHGLTAGDIAEQLVLSTSTVKTHLRNIYGKLGVADKAAAVAAGLRHGLID